MSWIHELDLVRLIAFVLHESTATGPFNGTAPNPVTNREFTKTLAGVLHRPAIFPIPQILLRAGLGEMSDFLFDSSRVIPARAEGVGFAFRFPQLRDALVTLDL